MPVKAHKIFAIALIVFLLSIIIWAALWGLADLLSYQTKNSLDQWQKQAPLQVSDTTVAMERIEKARALDSLNPDLMNYQAQIFEWRARLSNNNGNEFSNNLEHAAQLYRQSLTLRPSWAFDWIALARVKAQLQQWDSEFSKSLQRSNDLAPWEYQVQIQLIRIGFYNWQQLTSAEQDIIHESFDRALYSNQFPQFIKLAKNYDQLELFCARTNMARDYKKVIRNYACGIKQ